MTSVGPVFPREQEFLEAFGVSPASEEPDDLVFQVEIPTGDDVVLLSYDVVGGSVRCRVARGGRDLISLFRESVTSLAIDQPRGSTSLVAYYDVPGAGGRLRIRIYPDLAIEDDFLLR